jgi:hypothetical protein
MVHCPKCNRIIMDSTQDGGYKIRSRMIVFKDGKAIALCPTCKTDVEVPVHLGEVSEAQPKTKFIIST